MHAILHTLLALVLLANLTCLVGIYWLKGAFRDNGKVAAVAKACEIAAIALVVYLALLLTFAIWALTAKAFGPALGFLAFFLAPFAIGLAGDDYRKADRYIAWQLVALLLSLIAIPLLVMRSF